MIRGIKPRKPECLLIGSSLALLDLRKGAHSRCRDQLNVGLLSPIGASKAAIPLSTNRRLGMVINERLVSGARSLDLTDHHGRKAVVVVPPPHIFLSVTDCLSDPALPSASSPPLAQLDRAPGFEPGGWGFKSLGAGHCGGSLRDPRPDGCPGAAVDFPDVAEILVHQWRGALAA